MLVVETIARIRRERFVKGKSIKEIVRELKVSRNTVRKVPNSTDRRQNGPASHAYCSAKEGLPGQPGDFRLLVAFSRERAVQAPQLAGGEGRHYVGGKQAQRAHALLAR